MASIVTRKNKFAVVYSIKDENGVSRQKWETFDTKTDAKKRSRALCGCGIFRVGGRSSK